MGTGKAGFRLHGSEEVTRLCLPWAGEGFISVSGFKAHELLTGGSSPYKSLGKWRKGAALGRRVRVPGEKVWVRLG